ncbi:MAG: hypothetical protein PHS49_03390 [Candidatus Gracilibacteria bacterium]|nr:hypothetical protein [Candidatus Gracilibacteria bacterium]
MTKNLNDLSSPKNTYNVKISKNIENDIREGKISDETMNLIKQSVESLIANPESIKIPANELLDIEVLSKKIFEQKYPYGLDSEGYNYIQSKARQKMFQNKSNQLLLESEKHGTGLAGKIVYPDIDLNDILSSINTAINNSEIDKQEIVDLFETDLIIDLKNGFFNIGNVILYDHNKGNYYSILKLDSGIPFKLQGLINGGPIYLYNGGDILTQNNTDKNLFLNDSGKEYFFLNDTIYKVEKSYESGFYLLQIENQKYIYGGKSELFLDKPIEINRKNHFNSKLFYGFDTQNDYEYTIIKIRNGTRILINLDTGDSKLYEKKDYIPGTTTLHEYIYDKVRGIYVTKEQGEISQFNNSYDNSFIAKGNLMTNLNVDLGEFSEQLKDTNISAINSGEYITLIFNNNGRISKQNYNSVLLSSDGSFKLKINSIFKIDDFMDIGYNVTVDKGFFRGKKSFYQNIIVS